MENKTPDKNIYLGLVLNLFIWILGTGWKASRTARFFEGSCEFGGCNKSNPPPPPFCVCVFCWQFQFPLHCLLAKLYVVFCADTIEIFGRGNASC